MPAKRAYAEGTKVPTMQTLIQIQTVLKKAGASKFLLLSNDDEEGVAFQRDGITYHMTVAVPDDKKRAALLRALLLFVKAKIVAVDSGIQSFEEVFLSDVRTKDGRYGPKAVAEIRRAVESGHAPKSLPLMGGKG